MITLTTHLKDDSENSSVNHRDKSHNLPITEDIKLNHINGKTVYGFGLSSTWASISSHLSTVGYTVIRKNGLGKRILTVHYPL